MRREETRRSWLQRVAATYSAPALLVLTALLQIHLAWFEDLLTPAKGGGFGLFSTVDKLNNRQLRAVVSGDGWQAPVRIATPRQIGPLRTPMALPTHRELESAARVLLARRYPKPVNRIRVEVWKRSFDPTTLEARRIKLRERILPAE